MVHNGHEYKKKRQLCGYRELRKEKQDIGDNYILQMIQLHIHTITRIRYNYIHCRIIALHFHFHFDAFYIFTQIEYKYIPISIKI